MKYDVVYILKNDIQSDELRYSVRSVVKNFPYRKIWFYGGEPADIKPDVMVSLTQTGDTKWMKVNNTIREICKNDEITKSFWLFNDDFFIMKKITNLEPMVGGTLWARCQKIAKKHNDKDSLYSLQLKNAARRLRDKGYDRLDYALHVPMLIDREKGLKTLATFPDCPMFRSLYGNQHEIGGIISKDVKITSRTKTPPADAKLLSTIEESFQDGVVGDHIRKAFPDKCKYEL